LFSTYISQSGNFIFQNYRQALDKIETESQQLAALATRLKTTDADYENYFKAEQEHLQSLKSEPVEVQRAVDYMELLAKVHDLKYVPYTFELFITLTI
jgi:uncharacterized protein YfaQ (DUF2300 family)